MKGSVANRILNGFVAHIYGQVVVIVIQLAGIPIFLHAWGVDQYGEWLILSAIPVYLSLTDLGFSQSAANAMTARVGRGDHSGALEVFQSLTALIGCAAMLGLLLVTVAVVTLPFGDWLHFSSIKSKEIQFVVWLLAAEVLVKLFDGVNHAGFRSQGEYALHFFIYYSTLLIQNVSIWVIVLLGFGPVAAAWCYLIVRVISLLLSSLALRIRHPVLPFGLIHARLATLKALIKPALANVAIPLALATNIQGMTIIVGTLLGPVALVTFNALRTLTRFANSMIQSLTQAIEPEFARAWGANSQTLLLRLFTESLGYEIWLALGSATFLIIFGDSILSVWTDGRVVMNEALFGWLLFSSVISVFWATSLALLKASNKHLRASLWYIFASLMTVIAAFILIKLTNQVMFAGLSLLLVDGLMIILLSKQVSSVLDTSYIRIVARSVDPRRLIGHLMDRFFITIRSRQFNS